MTHPDAPIRRVSSRQAYKNRWMALRIDAVELSDGSASEYAVVERSDFVLILPVQDEQVLLVRQYRYPIGQWTWEFPQGACDIGEAYEDTARRELLEESGYLATDLTLLGILYEAAGFSTHRFHVVEALATDRQAPRLEASEAGMEAHWFNLKDLRELVKSGEMNDAPSLAALSLYLMKHCLRD